MQGREERKDCGGVKIKLGDPELVDGLLSFLERNGVAVSPCDVETVVILPDSTPADQARFWLEMWLALHPTATVRFVD